MSPQCFVTTTRAALTAHYSIYPRLGLSLTHLPPSEDQRFRPTWVGSNTRKKKKKEKSAFMSRCDLFKWDLEPGSEILFSSVYRTRFFHHKMRDTDACRQGCWFLKGLVKNWGCADQRNINLHHFTLIKTLFVSEKFKLLLYISFHSFLVRKEVLIRIFRKAFVKAKLVYVHSTTYSLYKVT